MTLTEEQRAAIEYAISSLEQCGSEPEDPVVAKILQAMIDSSEHVTDHTKMIGFDLERARGLRDFLQDDCAEVGDIWGEMIAEIERLQASLIDLHAEYINTLEKNPGCSAWDLDEQSDADQRRLRKNAAHAISIVEPPIYLQADQQVAKIKELKADLEQSERVIEARLDVIDQQVARIQELGGMLSIRTEELDIAHSVARSEKEMHEKELAAFARRIKELEDALVEERAGAIRCEFYDHCEIDLPDAMIRARQELQADGKIGPDAKPHCWQITEERKAALAAMSSLRTDVDCPQCDAWLHFSDIAEHAPVLRAMLTEAGL